MDELLLDTCALIWALEGGGLSQRAASAIANQSLHVSAISALEIAILMRKGRFASNDAPAAWFRTSLIALEAKLQPATPEIFFASQHLPGTMPHDPFDRVVIATARAHRLTVVTRDRAILAAGAAGHIMALAC